MPTMVKLASRPEFIAIRALFFLAPLITLLAPLTTVPVLIVLSIACVMTALMNGQRPRELFRLDLGLALFAVVAVYLFINATWSLDPSRAFGKAAWFSLIVLMTFAACRALGTWPERQLRAAFAAFLAGLVAGGAIVLIEVVTGQLLTRLLFNLLPFTRPDSAKTLGIKDGFVFRIAAFELNRNVAVMLLMLWPVLLCLSRLKERRWRLLGIVGLCLAVGIAILFSEHQTSKIGLGLSAIVFLIALPWPTLTRRAIWIGWCLAFVLVVPLASAAHQAQLHQADWLPFSAKARVILWAYTAEQIPKTPILGIGIASTRKNDKTLPKVEKPEGYVYAWRAGSHSHNQFLQTWYELGAVGVILLIAAGTSVFGYIGRLSVRLQPFIFAHLTAFLVIAAFSWGMWQSWLMAVTGLAAIYAAFAVNVSAAEARVPERAAGAPETST